MPGKVPLHDLVRSGNVQGLQDALVTTSTADMNACMVLELPFVEPETRFSRTLSAVRAQNPDARYFDIHQSLFKEERDSIDFECTPLILATYLGQLEMVQILVACAGVDVNSVSKTTRETALGIAASFGHVEILYALLSRADVQVNLENDVHKAPLHTAAGNGNVEIVKLLLAHADIAVNQVSNVPQQVGCNVFQQMPQQGSTPLFFAARCGFADIVAELLTHPRIDPLASNLLKHTPLMAAVLARSESTVERLMACPAVAESINEVDLKYSRTALMVACESGYLPTVTLLTASSYVNYDLQDSLNRNAMMIGIGSLDVVKHFAELRYNKPVRRILDLDIKTDLFQDLMRVFEFACVGEFTDAVKVMLDHAIGNTEAASDVYHSVLEKFLGIAIDKGKTKIVQYFLQQPIFSGPSLCNGGKWKSCRVLHHACEKGYNNIVDMLLNVGVDVNEDRNDYTALFLACEAGHTDVALALLEHPDIDTSIGRGNAETSIDKAVKNEMYEVVEKLIAHGDFFLIQSKSASILPHVAPYLRPATAELFLENDLPVDVDDNGKLFLRDDHLYSWNVFMDVSTPVNASVRLETVTNIVNQDIFDTCRGELIRELAYSQDKNGRTVLQITDMVTRRYFNDQLFFCGRYEIYDGPPIYVSSTAVVVNAFDHGMFKHLFDQFGIDGSLYEDGFNKCTTTLGQNKSTEFELCDKNRNGALTEAEFMRFCEHTYGGKIKVAVKFMRNRDEYKRELDMRHGWNSKSVLELLPMASEEAFKINVQNLTIHGNFSMSNYPYALVLPLADRSLEDIYLKERPNDNQIRNMLQEVGELLKELHENNIVHGDLKKLNVLRVDSHMRLIDMDAATKVEQDIGAKFSSGSLPPELFYKLQSQNERDMYAHYWQEMEESNLELSSKVQPRHDWVVKSFHSISSHSHALPYKPVKATPAIDMWSFGVMMYQFYSGVELVPTDRNQDVDENGIERAATWTKDDLTTRIQNKVSNPLARDLLMKLLTIDPADRISATAMLSHEYFDVKFDSKNSPNLQAIEKKIDQLSVQVATGFENVIERLDQVVVLNTQTIEALAATKGDLMRGIFQATEVHVPTSFVLFPFNILDKQDEDEDEAAVTLEQSANFIQKGIAMGANFMKAVKSNKTIGTAIKVFSAGEPLYLYLIDEVHGAPVVPSRLSKDDPPLYPIKIETKSDEYINFIATAMPYIQTGFKFIKGINTVATLAKSLGVPSLDKEVMANIGDNIEKAKKTSSVFDFQVLQTAVEAHDSAAPVHFIRGAALRELERFFAEKDKERNFSGLGRTYSATGQALWTTKESIATFESTKQSGKFGGETPMTKNAKKGLTAQEIFSDVLRNYRPDTERRTLRTPGALAIQRTELSADNS
ncbi:Aste57867_17608 [Aphanomyces stellatus]|uniref:Aste57867_17608 protein n=1 Tax=Aphanomyces stellatus TaxID=120398 RepID=A0A485L8C8_9STRA|nr:hypothetical protein As57867_017548 [Aphanomyces stellatus]VFT94359.1 Aste57867_17608 [Aphanomyces stellatus]